MDERSKSTITNLAMVILSGVGLLLFVVAIVSSSTITPEPETIQTYDSAWDFWLPRVLIAITLIQLAIILPIRIYLMKFAEMRYNHIERMEALKIQKEISQPKERPILMTQRNVSRVNKNEVILSSGNVSKDTVVKFVKNVMDVGLSISSWRGQGLKQEDVEIILDHMQNLRLISERSKGKSASWNRDLTSWELVKYFPIERIDLE
jgi:hypothetical protein